MSMHSLCGPQRWLPRADAGGGTPDSPPDLARSFAVWHDLRPVGKESGGGGRGGTTIWAEWRWSVGFVRVGLVVHCPGTLEYI